MIKLLYLFFLLNVFYSNAQSNNQFVVTSKTLAMRDREGKGYEVLTTLVKNDVVTLLKKNSSGWWNVSYKGVKGYVPSQFLAIKQVNASTSTNYKSGDLVICDNENFAYDYNLDNHLKVLVDYSSDVVLKLVQKRPEGDVCIRTVFIESSDFVLIRNIPEGKYYLKIAFGENWQQKTIDGECYGVFTENARYEIGKQQLNYKVIQFSDRVDIPSYSLSLGVKAKEDAPSSFTSFTISQDEFNE